MKKLNIVLLLLLCIFLVNITEVKAYSKQDIINISYDIKPCSSRTKSLINGYRSSYQRLLNERDVSQSDLDKIYNNISQAVNILKKSGICSVEQKSSVDAATKNKLYSLYDEASEILVNSPMLSNNKKVDSKIVIDSSSKEIKIYQEGSLSDVIKLEEKLNYVGINKLLIVFMALLLITLVVLIMVKVRKKENYFINGIIYSLILVLSISFVFRDKLSIGLDMISLMRIKEETINKEVVVKDKKIISYPLYGDKYGSIKILNEQGDIYFGDSSDILKKGVGQSSFSVLPGEEGTTILSGHNTGVLSKLFDTKKDNKIIIETIYGKFTYKVVSSEVIDDTSYDSLYKDYDLIIYTCYPNKTLYGNKRLIVYSKLVDSDWVGDNNEK